MPDFLPYRYVEKLGRVVFCRTCHQALASGDPYVLTKNWASQRIEVSHYPSCPRQTKRDENSPHDSRMIRT